MNTRSYFEQVHRQPDAVVSLHAVHTALNASPISCQEKRTPENVMLKRNNQLVPGLEEK